MATLEFFFDYSSPFAYLGSTQVRGLAERTGATLVYKPFFLGGLFRAIGTPDVPLAAMPDAKRDHARLDLRRYAALYGVELNWPRGFPIMTVDALRLTLLAPEAKRPDLVDRIFRLCWVEDTLPKAEALATCCSDVGVDPELVARVKEPAIKKAVIDGTEEAKERGVFGAPTYFVGDEMFWGQDRAVLVEHHVKALGA
ncbi:MAG: 2-hydroxychromene-2-carboxylate isomerase [Myxococcota bacterium]